MDQSISKKIELLNQTTLSSLIERDILRIIQYFTDAGLTILDADFGFAWWMTPGKTKYHLVYKSKATPYEPELPRERGGNFEAKKTRMPVFIENVSKENYEEGFDVSVYMKSYVIIPITNDKNIYGSIVICFCDKHVFSEVDRQLATSLGNATAQSITIHNFIEKEHQNMLATAQQETEINEDRIRTEFIVNAAHEIRTPLAIIRGSADIELLKKTLQPTAKKALRVIGHEVDHLSMMINDLITLSSKNSTAKNDTVFSEIDINDILNEIVKRFKTLIFKKKIKIKTSYTPNLIVMGDESQLEKLFMNLIKNAINYGKKGGWIKIKTINNQGRVVINISDNGIGISDTDLPSVFNRFFRADKSRGGGQEGTGLGLAIVRFITKLHGGTVSVESTLGKGSCFSVSLPKVK